MHLILTACPLIIRIWQAECAVCTFTPSSLGGADEGTTNKFCLAVRSLGESWQLW